MAEGVLAVAEEEAIHLLPTDGLVVQNLEDGRRHLLTLADDPGQSFRGQTHLDVTAFK